MDVGLSESAEFQERAPDPRQILDILGRRRRCVALLAGLAAAPALAFAALKPDTYEATARVAIQQTPEVMELGPDYMPSPPSDRASRSISDLVGSDTILGAAVDGLSDLAPEFDWTERLRSAIGLRGPALTPQQQRQLRIGSVRERLRLEIEGAGTILELSVQGRDAARAAALANAVANAFIEYRRSERELASRRAVDWLSERALGLRKEIAGQKRAIAKHVDETAIVSATSRESRERGARVKLLEELRSARLELSTVREQLAGYGGAASRAVAAESARRDRQLLGQQYAQARAQLRQARLEYTPEHPEVAKLEAMVTDLGRELGQNGGPPGIDVERLHALQAEESELRARVTVLERAVAELAERAEPRSQALVAYDRMQRQLAISQELLGVLLERRSLTLLAAATGHAEVRMLDPAVAPVRPVGSRVKLALLGAGLALGLAVLFALVQESLDRRVRDPEEVARVLDAPLLGIIPRIAVPTPSLAQGPDSAASPAAESYRNLRTALMFSGAARPLATMLVTSALADQGKTTISANLSLSFAEAGRNVLLVDADLRRARQHRAFAVDRAPGLTELLRGETALEDATRRLPDVPFDLVPSGEIPDDPAELLDSGRFDLVLAEAAARYDLVVLDSGVLLSVPDALLIASRVDATLLVDRAGGVERAAWQRMREDLERVRARVVGFVLNQVERRDRQLYPSYLQSPYPHASRPRRAGSPPRRAFAAHRSAPPGRAAARHALPRRARLGGDFTEEELAAVVRVLNG